MNIFLNSVKPFVAFVVKYFYNNVHKEKTQSTQNLIITLFQSHNASDLIFLYIRYTCANLGLYIHYEF